MYGLAPVLYRYSLFTVYQIWRPCAIWEVFKIFADIYKARLLKEWDEICLKVKAGLEKLGLDIQIVSSCGSGKTE